MSGYNGYSMSNNAVSAYNNGMMPRSKWTKAAIIAAYADLGADPDLIVALRKAPAAAVKDACLYKAEWHHTSCWYNSTDFYAVDEDVTTERIATYSAAHAAEKSVKPEAPASEVWEIKYLVWSGTRKHPKATEHTAVCEIVCNWAITPDGKKSTKANGFVFVRRVRENG